VSSNSVGRSLWNLAEASRILKIGSKHLGRPSHPPPLPPKKLPSKHVKFGAISIISNNFELLYLFSLQSDEGGGRVCALRGGRHEAYGHLLSVFRWRGTIQRHWYRRLQTARTAAPGLGADTIPDESRRLSLYRVLPARLLLRYSTWHCNLRPQQRQVALFRLHW